MRDTMASAATIGQTLQTSKLARAIEIVGVFVLGLSAILCGGAVFGESQAAYIGSIWAANLLMLAIVYLGLRLRGQDWTHFGLVCHRVGWRTVIRVVLQSLLVFIVAILAFVAGAILMANLVGMPEGADMTRYEYLRGNLTMTILALASVYVVSAFAEEVIYRGFLITRVTELISDTKTARCLAVVFSSLVFGLVHSDWGLAGMVQASCMGLALGASYLIVRRNLWVTILAHGYMDTILVLQMYFSPG